MDLRKRKAEVMAFHAQFGAVPRSPPGTNFLRRVEDQPGQTKPDDRGSLTFFQEGACPEIEEPLTGCSCDG